MQRTIKKGQAVVFIDPSGVHHDALITTNHSNMASWDDELPLVGYPKGPGDAGFNWPPCINVVYVVDDDKRVDQYGNQTVHMSSVVHETVNMAGGNCWRLKS